MSEPLENLRNIELEHTERAVLSAESALAHLEGKLNSAVATFDNYNYLGTLEVNVQRLMRTCISILPIIAARRTRVFEAHKPWMTK